MITPITSQDSTFQLPPELQAQLLRESMNELLAQRMRQAQQAAQTALAETNATSPDALSQQGINANRSSYLGPIPKLSPSGNLEFSYRDVINLPLSS